MTNTKSYDSIVIGTGQGGKPLASALAESGRRTAIIERADRVGGTCILWGCTPTKTMIASARVAHLVRRAADYGVRTGGVEIDQRVVRKRKRDIVEKFSGGSQKGMEAQEGLDLLFGEARFAGPHRLEVSLNESGHVEVLEAKEIFINVGARAREVDVPGLDQVDYLDSTSIMELGDTPEHLVVLGGGFIGLEFGQMFRRFGSAVTILDQGERLLPREDPEFGDAMAEILREEGVDLRWKSEVVRVESDGPVTIVARVDGEEGAFTGSHLLMAGGRRPNTETLHAAAAGIELTERGHIRVNEKLETSVPGVWALGDVTGGPPFTHSSYDDFRIITENLLQAGNRSTADRIVPYVLYTDPEYGRVGLSETEAKQQGRPYAVASMPMSRVARALESDETRGLMKAIVDTDTKRILGAAVLGVAGGEIMSMMQVAMIGNLPYTALRDGIFAHPTFAESLNNLFGDL